MNQADVRGNGQFLGPDPYFDELFLMAAKRRLASRRYSVPLACRSRLSIVPAQ